MRAPVLFFHLFAGLTCFVSTRLYAHETKTHSGFETPARCAQVELTGAHGTCTPTRCTLSGDAELICGALRLRADALTVDADPNHRFARAMAVGHVQLTQAQIRVDADALTLNQDRISGNVKGATLRVLREQEAAERPDAEESALVAHGMLERKPSGQMTLTNADVTLCDCGRSCPPTWRLKSPRVQTDGRRRAFVLWPRLEIHIARGWMLPVTPPLFFISLPLSRRAAGFLPPKVRFYAAARPTVDLPFFVPLGPHVDLTLTPGLRTDWSESRSAYILGAPRLGARVRYAPLLGTCGEVSGVATYDVRQRKNASLPSPLRLRLDWRHDSALGDAQEVAFIAHWLSDAQYLRDFGIRPSERLRPYAASRGQWLVRRPQWVTALSFDALQPLAQKSLDRPLAGPTRTLRQTFHRIPAWRATILPRGSGLSWAPRQILRPTGEIYAAHYARPMGHSTDETDADHALSVFGVIAGAQSVGLIGPVATRLSLGVDMLGVATKNESFAGGVSGRVGGEFILRAVGALGAWQHLIEPRLRLEAITPLWGKASVAREQEARGLDEHLRLRQRQQASLSLSQRVMHARGFVAHLDVAQPLDLRTRALLQPEAFVSATLRERAAIEGRITLRPWAGRQAQVREAHLSGWLQVGGTRLAANYARVAPNADRATRSIYELSAPTQPDAPAIEKPENWVHSLTGRVMAQVTGRVSASYQGSYQLPRPGARGSQDCLSGGRHCFVYHQLEAQLTSACHCWGLTALLGVAPGNPAQTFRVQLGFTLGAEAKNFWRKGGTSLKPS